MFMSDFETKVSIIVTCYNLAKYLYECLESVQKQTHTNWECIIVDDGSTDNTKQVCDSFMEIDTRFIYHYQKNQGVACARNVGIALTKGNFILSLDADDKIAPEYLSSVIQTHREHPEATIVYTDCICFDENKSWIWTLPDYSFRGLLDENLITATALIRRSDFEKSEGYDPLLFIREDWDLWLSILEPSSKVVKIDRPLFFYRQLNTSRNKSIPEDKWEETKKRLYFKHIKKYQMFDEFSTYEKYINYRKIRWQKKLRQQKIDNFIKSLKDTLRSLKGFTKNKE